MNKSLLALAIAATLLPGTAGARQEGVVARAERMLRDPAAPGVLVASHRACWGPSPENSLVGIRACIAAGIDVIEIDVRQTADGQLVLMHDSTLDRMTDGHGKLSAIRFAELRKLRLKPGMGGRDLTETTGNQVPTLTEALAAAKDRVMINMDAKEPLQDRIFAEVEKAGMAGQVIMKMRADPADPKLAQADFVRRSMFMPVIFACGPAITDHEYCAPALAPVVQGYARFHPIGYELIFENGAFVDVAAVAEARRHGRIWVNSLKPEMAGGVSDATAVADPDGVWGKLIGQGVTMIQTDHPRELLAYLRRRGLHE